MTHKVIVIEGGKRVEQGVRTDCRRPEAEAWLASFQGIREGRAFVREELARDFHAQGMTRAADREYEIAKAIRSGEC